MGFVPLGRGVGSGPLKSDAQMGEGLFRTSSPGQLGEHR